MLCTHLHLTAVLIVQITSCAIYGKTEEDTDPRSPYDNFVFVERLNYWTNVTVLYVAHNAYCESKFVKFERCKAR